MAWLDERTSSRSVTNGKTGAEDLSAGHNRGSTGVDTMGFRHGAVATVAACLLAASAAPARADAPDACSGDGEAAVVCLVNEARASLGLRELRRHRLLATAAGRYARRMAGVAFFSHHDPDGAGPAERMLACGYGSRRARRPWTASEALGQGSGALATPQALVFSWLASRPHRRILLGRGYRHVGVGIADRAGTVGALTERTSLLYAGRR